MRKKILIITVCVALTAVVCFGILIPWFSYKTFVAPMVEEQERTLAQHIGTFKKEYSAVAPLVDWNSGNEHDAGAMLDKRVPWSHNADRCLPACDLHLDDNFLEQLKDNAWFGLFETSGTSLPDSSWMANLKNYDHWDLFSSPETELSERGLLEHNRPAYKYLIGWAKIRLAAGIASANLTAATTEVRHLAKLLHSQGTLVSTMAAVAILKAEATVLTRLKESEHPASSSLTALSLEDVQTLKRVCWVSGLLFHPMTADETLTELYNTDRYSLCRCMGITEGLVMGSSVPPALRDRYLPARQKLLADIATQQTDPCRLRPILNAPKNNYTEDAKRLAQIARFLGPFWTNTIAGFSYAFSPSAFRDYDEKLKNKSNDYRPLTTD